MNSIRFKITAVTIAAILTSILSVFVVSNASIAQETDRRNAEIMNLQAHNTASSLDRYFESIRQSVEMTANYASDTLDSVILLENGAGRDSSLEQVRTEEQEEAVNAYLSRYCADVQGTFATIAGHTIGVITYYYCINPEVSETEHGFFFSKVGKTGFQEREPLDARTLDPEDIEHTTWYYTPIERGRPSWVGPYTAHFLNEMRICSYLVPIYKSGILIGVLGMDISMETLLDQVSELRVYRTGFACLLDQDGKVIYHPDVPAGESLDLVLEGDKDLVTLKDSGDTLIRYSSDGESRQMAITTLSSGMKLAIVVPTDELNAYWNRFEKVIFMVTAAVMVIYALLLFLITGVLTNPLRRLTSASRKLADGDYDVRLDYAGRDEVGELTTAFSQMRDRLKLSIEDLNHRIRSEVLTDLPNMRYFFELANQEKNRLIGEGKTPVILFFNVAGMKHFNRQYGFDAGDQMIRAVGDILVRHFGYEHVGHMGKDQFAAITEEDHLEETLNQILQECSKIPVGNMPPVRIGIYNLDMRDRDAQVACDSAKYACDLNRNSYESGYYYFTGDMRRKAQNTRHILSHLDQAIAEKWISVCYQPIIRTANGKVSDEEALSRWHDPERGTLSPAEFIPVLEEARLIYKLDLYVVEQVLEKIRKQQEAGLVIVPHSVNISREDFDSCDIVEEICRRVDAAGVSRDRITIEITESTIGRDFDFMKQQIDRFRSLGFPVWMDDFGSGYSSLDVLQSLEFDLIKFDMSFLRNMKENNENSRIILKDLMKMARELGLETLCEGVETGEQVSFLRSIGCSKMQGYYFCKAISFEEIKQRYDSGTQIGYESESDAKTYTAAARRRALQ